MPVDPPRFICTDVRVRDLARSCRFYRMFGLRVVSRVRMEDGSDVVWLRDPVTHQVVELFRLSRRSPLYRPYPSRPGPEHALLFSVRDLGPLLRRLRRRSTPLDADFDDGPVRLAFVRDPDGNRIELLGWTDQARRVHRGNPLDRLVGSRRAAARGR